MKRNIIGLLFLALAIGWLFYGVSCSLLGISPDDRVNHFVTDINELDRSDVYLNFHPDIFNMAGAQDPDTWEAQFPVANIPYTFSALDTADPSNVTFAMTDKNTVSWNIRFVMEKLDNDWMIVEMYKDAVPLPPTTLIID